MWKTYTIAQEAKPGAINAAGFQLMGPSGRGSGRLQPMTPQAKKIYVTTGNNHSDPPTETSDAFLALNADSGEVAWSRQITPGDAWNNRLYLSGEGKLPESQCERTLIDRPPSSPIFWAVNGCSSPDRNRAS